MILTEISQKKGVMGFFEAKRRKEKERALNVWKGKIQSQGGIKKMVLLSFITTWFRKAESREKEYFWRQFLVM